MPEGALGLGRSSWPQDIIDVGEGGSARQSSAKEAPFDRGGAKFISPAPEGIVSGALPDWWY